MHTEQVSDKRVTQTLQPREQKLRLPFTIPTVGTISIKNGFNSIAATIDLNAL